MLSILSTFSGLILTDLFGIADSSGNLQQHLNAAQDWLKRAQDHGNDNGVSYGYSIKGGWLDSYRETSGYIATTFFALAERHPESDYFERAVNICHWLLSVQNTDGSFANPRYGSDGIVFDTGQDLFGLVKAFEKTADPAFKQGAARAAAWLIKVVDERGIWSRFEHLNTAHVYNARTAWALLRMRQIVDQNDPNASQFKHDLERTARANLDWAVAEQQSSGFFDNCAFERGKAPFTHTIAYTTRGLLESGRLLQDQTYLDAAQRCADATLRLVQNNGLLPGQLTLDGQPAANYCCLTGNCQFAIIWAKLFQQTGDTLYQQAAIRALNYVMRHQNISTSNQNIHGAIKGSHPIWGRYSPLSFPNWPAKFFVDAMLLRMEWNVA